MQHTFDVNLHSGRLGQSKLASSKLCENSPNYKKRNNSLNSSD